MKITAKVYRGILSKIQYFFLAKPLKFFISGEKKHIDIHRVKNILIFGYMGMGDMILFVPTIRAVRKKFPNAKISLWCGGDTGAKEVVENIDLVDEVVAIDLSTAGVMKTIAAILKLFKQRFDLVISNYISPTHIYFLSLLRIPVRVGACMGGKYDFIFNIKVPVDFNTHSLEGYLKLAYALGIEEGEVEKNLEFGINDSAKVFALDLLEKNNVCSTDIIVAVHVGASFTQRWKLWPFEKYIELFDRLIEGYDAKIILLGSIADRDLIEPFKEELNKKKIIDIVGKTNAAQAGALIERSSLFISADSGLMHVSAAVGTPIVAIYGPTNYSLTHPYTDEFIAVRKDFDCMPCYFRADGKYREYVNGLECENDYKCLSSIKVEDVLAAVEKLLDKTDKSRHMTITS